MYRSRKPRASPSVRGSQISRNSIKTIMSKFSQTNFDYVGYVSSAINPSIATLSVT